MLRTQFFSTSLLVLLVSFSSAHHVYGAENASSMDLCFQSMELFEQYAQASRSLVLEQRQRGEITAQAYTLAISELDEFAGSNYMDACMAGDQTTLATCLVEQQGNIGQCRS